MKRMLAAVAAAAVVVVGAPAAAVPVPVGGSVVEGVVRRVAVSLSGGGGFVATLVEGADGPVRVAEEPLEDVPVGASVRVELAAAVSGSWVDAEDGADVGSVRVLEDGPGQGLGAVGLAAAPVTGERSVAVVVGRVGSQVADGTSAASLAAMVTTATSTTCSSRSESA